MLACERGHNRLVQLLILYGADVNFAANNTYYNLLDRAAVNCDVTTVKALLDDPSVVAGQGIKTVDSLGSALYYASYNCIEMVELLLDYGAPIDYEVARERVLFRAIHEQQNDIVALLIERGADLYLKDVYGKTALQHSLKKKYDDITKLIIQHGDLSKLVDDKTAPLLVKYTDRQMMRQVKRQRVQQLIDNPSLLL